MRDLYRPVAAFALLVGAAACTNGVTFPARESVANVPSRPNTSGQAASYGATSPGAPGGTSTRPIQVQRTVSVVDRGPKTDGQILSTLAALDRREVELSELARRRSGSRDVQAFASNLIKSRRRTIVEREGYIEHTNASFQRAAYATDVREDTSETVEDLRERAGSDFDAEYLDAIVRSKEETLDFIDNQALDRATDTRLQKSLRAQRARTERELEAAKALRDRVEDET